MPDNTTDRRKDRVDIVVRRTNYVMTVLLGWISKHWLLTANVLIGSLIILPLLAPVLMHLGFENLGNLIHRLFQAACHQLPQRSFFLFGPQTHYSLEELAGLLGGEVPSRFVGTSATGYKMAVCERDTAIYASMFLAGLAFQLVRKLKPLRLVFFGALALPMVVDGAGQLVGLWSSTWQSRVITGALFGVACIWLSYPYLEQGMRDIHVETGNILREMEA